MARTTEAGRRWAAWLDAQMAARGWSRQSDLVKASNDEITRQTVSKWLQGAYPADPNSAVVCAVALGVDPAEALRAAGYDRIADLLAGRPLHLAGEAPAPLDPNIKEILEDDLLSPDQKADLVEFYKARRARAEAEMNALRTHMREARGDAGTA